VGPRPGAEEFVVEEQARMITRRESLLLAATTLALALLALTLSIAPAARADGSGPTKLTSAQSARHGQMVTYTIVVRDLAAPPTATIYLTDDLPTGLSYLPGTLTATSGLVTDTGAPALCWSGTLSPTPAVTVTYAVSVSAAAPQVITNAAVIVAPGYPPLTPTAWLLANPYRLSLPQVTRWYPAFTHTTYSDQSWQLLGRGANLAEARSGADEVWRYDPVCITANFPPYQTRTVYLIQRSFVTFDLAGSPQGVILSATLELYTEMINSIEGDFEVSFHLGEWTGTPTKADWNRYGAVVGTYDTSQWQPGPDPIWIPLPGLVGRPVPPQLKLVARGDEVTELPPGLDRLTAYFSLQVLDDEFNYVPAARLHLVIGGGR